MRKEFITGNYSSGHFLENRSCFHLQSCFRFTDFISKKSREGLIEIIKQALNYYLNRSFYYDAICIKQNPDKKFNELGHNNRFYINKGYKDV